MASRDGDELTVRARGSCIRVTPNVFTTLEEVDTFSAAIEDAARHGLA